MQMVQLPVIAGRSYRVRRLQLPQQLRRRQLLTGLVAGTYQFQLTVTDNSGATATDIVSVIVNAAVASNQAPIADAGANQVITLPTNSITL